MKKLSLTIKSLVITGLLVAGIGTATAFWSNPPTPPEMPNPNIFEPITTSATAQRKTGGIVAKSLIAGSGIASSSTAPIFTWNSFIMAKTLAAAPYGLLQSDHALVSGKDSKVKIGFSGTLGAPLIGSQYTTPLTLDLTGRTSSAPASRNADEFISGNSCNVSIGTNTSAIRFVDNQSPASNNSDSHNVNLIARQLRLSGGNADAMRVLVATNDRGDAVWGTLTIEAGKVKVNYDRSPVTDSQLCSTTTAYHWETGAWGQCVNFGGVPTFSTTWEPVSNNPTVASAAVYGPNVSSLGKYCPAPATFTYVTGTQSRTVTCVDSNGTPAPNESYCTAPKPEIVQNCTETKNVEYRVTSATQSLNSGRIYSQGTPLNNNCVYRKPMDTTPILPPSDAFLDIVALDCKVLPISNRTSNISGYYAAGSILSSNYIMSSLPLGTVPDSHCGYITTPDADYMAPPSGFHPGSIDNGTLHRYIFEYRLKP